MKAGSRGGDGVRVNGRPSALGNGSLTELLEQCGVAPSTRGIAVAINGRVVPRSEWESREIAPGDEIEIVGATQGG